MTLEQLYLKLLKEQPELEDPDPDLPDDKTNNEVPPQPKNEPEAEPEMVSGSTLSQDIKPQKVKPLSEIQRLKLKWKEENPGLTEQRMDEAIAFFNRRKNGMIEYMPPGTINPYTNRRHVNLPEISAMVNKFPELRSVLSDHSKIRDIQNYTWEQIEFYIDRVSTQNSNLEIGIKIEGDTLELQKESAYKIWENSSHKIIDENGLIVIKVQSKPEAISLGYLQHIINSQASKEHNLPSNNWCITHGANEGTNLYYDYRPRRAYYFVMDKNRNEYDAYLLSVLQPIKDETYYGYPYVVTLRTNMGDRSQLEWKEILEIWPALNGKEHLIKYFELTPYETDDLKIDRINFREHTTKQPNPYDFAIQSRRIQLRYIDSNRYINTKRCFEVLSIPDRKTYIGKTTLTGGDYKKRFRCHDPGDPLGIIKLIQDSPGALDVYLDRVILQNKLGIRGGLNSLIVAILSIETRPLYATIDKNYRLFQSRGTNLVGLIDMTTFDTIKHTKYTHTSTKMGIDSQLKKPYFIYTYVYTNYDYFYFIIPAENLTGSKTSEHYMKGYYYDKDEGDELFNSGKIKLLTKYI